MICRGCCLKHRRKVSPKILLKDKKKIPVNVADAYSPASFCFLSQYLFFNSKLLEANNSFID